MSAPRRADAPPQLAEVLSQFRTLIADWRTNVLQIGLGPYLEGAAFQQCADQCEQLTNELQEA